MQSGLLAHRIISRTKVGYRGFSPLSMLMREHIIMRVKADSKLAKDKDLVARLGA